MSKTILHFTTNISKNTWFFFGMEEFCKQVSERISGYVYKNDYSGLVHLATSGLRFISPTDVEVMVTYKPEYSDRDEDVTEKDIEKALSLLIDQIIEETNKHFKEYFLTAKMPCGKVGFAIMQFWYPSVDHDKTTYAAELTELKFNMEDYVRMLYEEEEEE